MALLSWLSRSSGKARTLLAAYADDVFIHAGPPGGLSVQQRLENLEAFCSSVGRRIDRLVAFAGALDTQLPKPDGDLAQAPDLSHTLDRLVKERLLDLTEAGPALAGDWRERSPQGIDRKVQTLIIDIGTFCGEIGIACSPTYQWMNDDTRYSTRNRMRTSGRIVIGRGANAHRQGTTHYVDAIDIVAFAVSEVVKLRTSKALWRPNYFHFLGDLAQERYP